MSAVDWIFWGILLFVGICLVFASFFDGDWGRD